MAESFNAMLGGANFTIGAALREVKRWTPETDMSKFTRP